MSAQTTIRESWRSAVTVCVAIALIASATAFGLRASGTKHLNLASDHSLDYGRGPTGIFNPLDNAALAALFGRDAVFGSRTLGGDNGFTNAGGPSQTPAGPGGTGDPANTSFDRAKTIDQIEYTDVMRTHGVTNRDGPTSCAPVGGTVWYRYIPQHTLDLEADTLGSDFATSLGVFEGDSVSTLSQVACARGTGGVTAKFKAIAGHSYAFQITGPAEFKDLVFHVAQPGLNQIMSLAADGKTGSGGSFGPAMSSNGRYVLLQSYDDLKQSSTVNEATSCKGQNLTVASYLVPVRAGNCIQQIFLRDRLTNEIDLISQTTDGKSMLDQPSRIGAESNTDKITPSGRFVVFSSFSSVGDPRNTNRPPADETYLRDRLLRTTTLVSNTNGRIPSGFSNDEVITADGRYIFFDSNDPHVLSNRTTKYNDIFRFDRLTNKTILISTDSHGRELPMNTLVQAITPDGKFLQMLAYSDSGKQPTFYSMYVRNVETGAMNLVSGAPNGRPANDSVGYYSAATAMGGISDDGRYVAFQSMASNLVPVDTNGSMDCFVHDMLTGTTTRVSVTSLGRQTSGSDKGTYFVYPLTQYVSKDKFYRDGCTISGNGRYILITSSATDLVEGDTNNARDVFVHDMKTGTTRMVSLAYDDALTEQTSYSGAISDDGQIVCFASRSRRITKDSATSVFDVYVRNIPRGEAPLPYTS